MIGNLRIGFFSKFKGADTVLLSGSPADIGEFKKHLEDFASAPVKKVDIKTLANVSTHHPVTLWLAKSEDDVKNTNGFIWVCGKVQTLDIHPKLTALAKSSEGHQYFDLIGQSARLIVSVGEYDESWWNA